MTKETALGGVAFLGTGGTLGYGVYVYSKSGTIGYELSKEGKHPLLTSDSNENTKNLWKLLAIRHSEESETSKKITGVDGAISDDSKLDEVVKKLQTECNSLIEKVYSEENKADLEKARNWCTKSDDVAADLISSGNKPIVLVITSNTQTTLYKKSYDRYFVEVEDGDKLTTVGEKSTGREAGTHDESSGHTNLKKDCETLLKTKTTDSDYSNKKSKASKWCVEFVSGNEGKNIDEDATTGSDEKWKSKYEEVVPTSGAVSNENLKKILEAFKNKESETDDTKKKANALKKWCKIAINAKDTSKSGIDKCILKSSS